MDYVLGVDLGTTFTAAAVRYDGRAEVVQLGSQRPEIPSVVYLKPDGGVLVGEAADRRGRADPARVAREFKRRVGDNVPIRVGESSYSAETLMVHLLRGVLETVVSQQEGPPTRLGLTCPANWGVHRRGLLEQAVARAGVDAVELHTEPEAAAIQFATGERVRAGEVVAVYDLGGGTFDAAALRKTDSGFELLGEPSGIDQLGGIDFDQAVLRHVSSVLGPALTSLDPDDPAVVEALERLRRDCVEAKEVLSYDAHVDIPVALPALHTRVRLTRTEFNHMIAPALGDTVDALDRTLRSANLTKDSLRSIVLAGGSARIPLVAEYLSARFGRPLVLDASPEHSIALGAAQATRFPTRSTVTAPGSTGTPAVVPGPAAAERRQAAQPVPTDGAGPGPMPPARRSLSRSAVVASIVGIFAVLALLLGLVFGTGRQPEPTAQGQPVPTPVAPAAGWQLKADLPVALEGAAVTAYQDKVWVAGGLMNDEARTKLSTVFVYDPGSDQWSSGPSLPRPTSHGALVATPSNLYFIGGWLQDGFGSAQVLKLNSTNTAWIADVPLPDTRVAGVGAFDGRWVIYAGGTAKGGVATDTVWALRGARWASIGRLAEKRQKLAAVTNNVDTVWVLGGRDQQTNEKFGTIDRIYQGRVVKERASAAAPISPPVDSAAAVRLDGIGMCLIGGETPGKSFNGWWCDQAGAAAKLPALDPPRAGLGAARIGQTIYVVGGYGATFQGTTLLEAYTPPTR